VNAAAFDDVCLWLPTSSSGPSGWSLFHLIKQSTCGAHFWKSEVGDSLAETVRTVEWARHSSGVWFILLNEVFRWSPLTRHALSKHIKIEWCFGIQSPQLRLMQLSYSLRRKVSHLTGIARPGCVCSLSHSFRSSSDDGDHDRYTKWLQSMYAVRWKAQAGEIVLAFCVG
jgi:hypothetical protein